MRFGVTFNNENVGRDYKILMDQHAARTRRALFDAANEAMDVTLLHARANIAGAGNFGRRWTEGLQGRTVEESGSIITRYTHEVPYFSVFQFGAHIQGRPMLFIPFSFAADAQRVRARDYPGKLFRVVRKSDGLVMLWSVRSREPKYFGKESVTIPKKFRVLEIIQEVARNIKLFYVDHLSRR